VGLVVAYRDRKITLPLIDAVRIPIIGTQYKLLGMEELGSLINSSVESLIEINSRLGVLADHGAAPLAGMPGAPPDDPQAFGNLRELVSRNYSVAPVRLSEAGIPEGIACLLMVKPREKFNDYDLYQIDQFRCRQEPGSLSTAFDEVQMPQMPGQAVPTDRNRAGAAAGALRAADSAHIRPDENCYRQEMPRSWAGDRRSTTRC
jgi:hypothetical protein